MENEIERNDIADNLGFSNIQKHETPNKVDTKELQLDIKLNIYCIIFHVLKHSWYIKTHWLHVMMFILFWL